MFIVAVRVILSRKISSYTSPLNYSFTHNQSAHTQAEEAIVTSDLCSSCSKIKKRNQELKCNNIDRFFFASCPL